MTNSDSSVVDICLQQGCEMRWTEGEGDTHQLKCARCGFISEQGFHHWIRDGDYTDKDDIRGSYSWSSLHCSVCGAYLSLE
jgi:hypothetical protein